VEIPDLITDSSVQLREQGIVLLRDVFRTDSLTRLKESADRFFQGIGPEGSLPEHYQYNRFSNSALLTALMDFDCGGSEALWAALSAPGLGRLFSEAMGAGWSCNREQSWVRKKPAPGGAAPSGYHLQGWHQDGALGVRFPAERGPRVPMTELLTCWIPLNTCGVDSPGLEFVRRRQPALLHFTELDDSALRQRFSPQEFWTPALEFGDGLIFRNDILHRTSVREEMRRDRVSVEYRIMPGPVSGLPTDAG
jgi:hypothetical protein